MKSLVYVVIASFDYEGSYNQIVVKSKKKAEECFEEQKKNFYDNVRMDVWDVKTGEFVETCKKWNR